MGLISEALAYAKSPMLRSKAIRWHATTHLTVRITGSAKAARACAHVRSYANLLFLELQRLQMRRTNHTQHRRPAGVRRAQLAGGPPLLAQQRVKERLVARRPFGAACAVDLLQRLNLGALPIVQWHMLALHQIVVCQRLRRIRPADRHRCRRGDLADLPEPVAAVGVHKDVVRFAAHASSFLGGGCRKLSSTPIAIRSPFARIGRATVSGVSVPLVWGFR